MGAAVGVELALPVDGSDIETDNLGMARGEVVRLRNALGHLAKQAGFGDVVYDASDLCLGRDNQEDFDRCLGEVIHIRSALRLSTQGSKRRARPEYQRPQSLFDEVGEEEDLDGESSTDSSSDEGEGVVGEDLSNFEGTGGITQSKKTEGTIFGVAGGGGMGMMGEAMQQLQAQEAAQTQSP